MAGKRNQMYKQTAMPIKAPISRLCRMKKDGGASDGNAGAGTA
jgi:hypothetical protein